MQSIESIGAGRCRSCDARLSEPFLDLGFQPLANAYRTPEMLTTMEPHYPLRIFFCESCALVQAEAVEKRETIFADDYAYFSSYSTSWLAHARSYAERMILERRLDERSRVLEIASNDGYLLRWFAERGIPVYGVDPARGCAEAAERVGVPTLVDFFGRQTAERLRDEFGRVDLVVANNVLAHVPDPNDLLAGLATILAPNGLATFEFPHVAHLVRRVAYDTMYHEHYSYLSVLALTPLFARHALVIVDVERLTTHGGSLRLHVMHQGVREPSRAVEQVVAEERAMMLDRAEGYRGFAERVYAAKYALLEALIAERRAGRRVAAYGAAAKGNTLLNTAGIGGDLLSYVVDRNPHKVGRRMPGSHLPIRPVEAILEDRPDRILVLPWNLLDEIGRDIASMATWELRLFVAIPTMQEYALP